MLATVSSCALQGLDGVVVQVEVDATRGMPGLTVVGLPDAAVRESRERVRSAIKNSQLTYPGSRITVNLAPADIRKEGPAYDLPIAVGVLIASQQVWPHAVEDALIIGELSLDGSVRHVDGILPVAALARDEGLSTIFVPAEDAPEASLVSGLWPKDAAFLLALGQPWDVRWSPMIGHEPDRPEHHASASRHKRIRFRPTPVGFVV